MKAQPELVQLEGQHVPLADLGTAVAMKAAAVVNRGTKRDFIDVHAICSSPGWNVTRFVESACDRLPIAPHRLIRAMTYFQDAEREPMPRGCAVDWANVKRELETGVRQWHRARDRGLDR